jgi:hypothetical protein
LPGDIDGNSYLTSLIVGALGLDGTNFKAEILLRTNQSETLLGATTFVGGPAAPWPFQPFRITRDTQGLDPSSAFGDTLILRVTAVSGRPGLITYGAAYGQSYISIPDPLGLPSAPTLASPLDGSTGISTSPTLSWNASNKAMSYELQLSTSSTFSTTLVDQVGIMGTSFSMGGLANNIRYYWRVRSANNGGVSDWSSVWSFRTVVAPPASPVLAQPSDGAANQSTTLTLRWNQASGAATYRLQVSTSADFSTTVLDDSTLTMTLRQVGPLANNTTYYWRVNAKNAGGTGAWSSQWSFTTIIAPPSAPIPVSPSHGSTGISTNPTLTWSGSSGTTSYRLQITTDSTFATIVFEIPTITTTSRQVGVLANGTTYYWRVNAKNAAGTSAWSNVWSFTTVVAAPLRPILAFPSNGATDQSTTIQLSWNSATGAETYHLQVAKDFSFATKVFDDSSITTTSKQVGPLEHITTHFWRLKAKNSGGTSGWSSVWSFTTIVQLPSQVLLISPAHAAVIGTDSVQFSWQRSEPAVSRYWFEISTDSLMTNAVVDSTLAETTTRRRALIHNQTYWWRVRANNVAGWGPFSEQRRLHVDIATSIDTADEIPRAFSLSQNFPNPFNPTTTIKYQLSNDSEVSLSIYNLFGQLVATLVNEKQAAGYYSARWNGTDQYGLPVASGVYLYKLKTREFAQTRKMVLTR